MNEAYLAVALLLAVVWPLLVAAALVIGVTRRVASRLVSWAALPALVVAAALPDTALPLPGVMLGGILVLDRTGRVFLVLCALLWLAAGLLARSPVRSATTDRDAVIRALAMAGALGLTVAGDALLFFAAGTLAGYALYGLLLQGADTAARSAGRVLVVLLVVSDLLVFELFLVLHQAAGTTDFLSLREALVNSDKRGLMLGLLIAGFGIKMGVAGTHFWLAPAFVSAVPAVRPALIAFMFAGGVLGWLRLLPPAEVYWPVAGAVVQWLAYMTLGYAVFAGLLQARARAVLAYAAVALTALWMVMFHAALLHPQAWHAMAGVVYATILQSAFALSALLLLGGRIFDGVGGRLRRFVPAMMWLAALVFAAAPLAGAAAVADINSTAAPLMAWTTAALTVLAVRYLLLSASSMRAVDTRTPADGAGCGLHPPAATTLFAAGALTAAAFSAACWNLAGLSLLEVGRNALIVPAAAFAAWLISTRLVPLLRALPPGDLIVLISRVSALMLVYGRRLGDERLPRWRDTGLAALKRLWPGKALRRMVAAFESGLNRWSTVLVFLVLLGLVAAWQGRWL